MKINESPIRSKSFDFAVDIVKFSKVLKANEEFELAKQLIRSGTSVGANIREAQRGFSSKDFIHKMSISLKEADESLYWLELIEVSLKIDTKELKDKCEELIRILVAIIKTSTHNS
ncbi:four helix bundle protein [Lishizhenia sp.]|uniref:four helix bundle protein n=1 Tax=Lishizhenia sp. TaxID=2497594 RepID=UPI00299EB19D|nr:four helix bundle protein [Lishizhenia sp.]MDX1446016.1 four helix bundle protein [Lishizhenia sp.]